MDEPLGSSACSELVPGRNADLARTAVAGDAEAVGRDILAVADVAPVEEIGPVDLDLQVLHAFRNEADPRVRQPIPRLSELGTVDRVLEELGPIAHVDARRQFAHAGEAEDV